MSSSISIYGTKIRDFTHGGTEKSNAFNLLFWRWELYLKAFLKVIIPLLARSLLPLFFLILLFLLSFQHRSPPPHSRLQRPNCSQPDHALLPLFFLPHHCTLYLKVFSLFASEQSSWFAEFVIGCRGAGLLLALCFFVAECVGWLEEGVLPNLVGRRKTSLEGGGALRLFADELSSRVDQVLSWANRWIWLCTVASDESPMCQLCQCWSWSAWDW